MKSPLLPLLLTLTLAGCGADDPATSEEPPAKPATSRYKQQLDGVQQSADQLESTLSNSAGRADEALQQAH